MRNENGIIRGSCHRAIALHRESALQTALLETAPRVILAGGEERATWLLQSGMGSARSFAFSTVLSLEPEAGAGRIAFSPGIGVPDEPAPTLETLADALGGRRPLAWRGAGGDWSLLWT